MRIGVWDNEKQEQEQIQERMRAQVWIPGDPSLGFRYQTAFFRLLK